MSTETINMKGLIRRTCLVGIGTVIGLAALFFLPAGTFAYWQAWVYLAIVLIPMAFVAVYMLRNSPDLLQRRLQARERERTQQGVISFGIFFLLGAFLIPGFDRRWGWSTMPWWVVVAADLVVLLGYATIFRVFRENQYASRTVQVELGQQVVSTGPYAVVRHPMYQGMLMGPAGMMSGRGQTLMQQAALERVNQAVLIGGLVALTAALAIGFFVFRAITRPIEQLTRAAHQLAQGDLSVRVGVDDQSFASRLRRDQRAGRGVQYDGGQLAAVRRCAAT